MVLCLRHLIVDICCSLTIDEIRGSLKRSLNTIGHAIPIADAWGNPAIEEDPSSNPCSSRSRYPGSTVDLASMHERKIKISSIPIRARRSIYSFSVSIKNRKLIRDLYSYKPIIIRKPRTKGLIG